MRRLCTTFSVLILLVASLLQPHNANAQANRLCFNAPGITKCIEGRFREYWQQNGGLPVFGYPISDAYMRQTTEGAFLTQYFERNRFELHPEKARPYDVLLGRLGDDRLKQQGRDWTTLPKGTQTANCLWFAETGHSVCNQDGNQGFRNYWEGRGLQDPALNRFQRSLALFGLPLSEPTMETNAAGDNVLTQWFERARFEWHPGNPAAFRVLLGLLGNETRAAESMVASLAGDRDSFGTKAPEGSPVRLADLRHDESDGDFDATEETFCRHLVRWRHQFTAPANSRLARVTLTVVTFDIEDAGAGDGAGGGPIDDKLIVDGSEIVGAFDNVATPDVERFTPVAPAKTVFTLDPSLFRSFEDGVVDVTLDNMGGPRIDCISVDYALLQLEYALPGS
jgi:hypothetical protein